MAIPLDCQLSSIMWVRANHKLTAARGVTTDFAEENKADLGSIFETNLEYFTLSSPGICQ